MRKFKHKNTLRIAEQFDKDDYNIVRPKTEKTIETTFRGLPKELIEGSNDWIEIKEEDWIEKVVQDCKDNDLFALGKIGHRSIINKSINKHLPRITDDMIIKARLEGIALKDKQEILKTIKQNLPKDLLANPL